MHDGPEAPLRLALKAFSLTLIFAAIASYMVLRADAQLTTAEERGLPKNAAFSGSDIDSVNLQNGNLHINIPILTSKQRGGTVLTWNLIFDTQTYIKQAYEYVYPNCGPTRNATTQVSGASPLTVGGGAGAGGVCSPLYYYIGSQQPNIAYAWRVGNPYSWQVTGTRNLGAQQFPCPGAPSILYQPVNNWHVVEPNGTQHPLAIYEEIDSQGRCNLQTLQGPTTDGSGMYFNTQTGILVLKNGVQVQLTNYGIGSFLGGTMLDPNGNEAGPNDTMNRALVTTTNGPTTTYTSPLGIKTSGPAYTTYSVLDSNGNTQNYTVNYEAVDLNPNICSQNPGGVGTGEYTCTLTPPSYPLVISQITLPNRSSYKFSYYNNSIGEIQQITLPTGATISYTYADDYQLKFAGTQVPYSVVGSRGVATRTVTVNGSTYQWTYNIAYMGQTGATTTVTDPLGNVAVHNFGTLCVNNCTVASADVYELSTTYSDSQGHILRTVTNTYTPDYDTVNNTVSDGRLTNQVTTLDNGQQTQKQITYDSFTYSCNSGGCPGTGTRMNPVQVQDYDYGATTPGALLRTTNTSYQSFSIAGWTITKPQVVTVLDGSGNQASQTTYEYDNYSHTNQAMQASNAIQHSSTYSTSYTNRSNITAISKWRSSDGALLTSTNQYDDAGNLLSVIDPKGNQTSYSYTDSWSNNTCAPTGQGKLYRTSTTNAKGQTTSSTFNSCTGTVAATTDPNSQTTSVTYDLLNRVKLVTYPVGDGSTTYCYSDDPNGACYSSGDWFATQSEAITGSISVVHESDYDDLGRTIQSKLTSDPEGTVTTSTNYDGLGRVSQVSNPYRSGDTQYWTTTTYDGIGRVIGVTEQDNSVTSTSYSGNTTTITDEAGKQRKSQTDALGRLTSVWENPAGLNYETDYSYDVLGDLTKVVQKGGSTNSALWRTRTFAYDSLGELLCSANPEITSPLATPATCPNPDNGSYTAGTIRYAYDNDGNLTSRIAPKENQQGTATVTTTYAYDQLNRLTSKSYNDGTASAFYAYDGNPISGCTLPTTTPAPTNLVLHMSGMCDTSGATAWSYDPEGRTLAEARRIGSVTDQVSYGYTLNGVANSVTYPASGMTNPFTLTYNVNAADRVYSVTDGTTTYAQVTSTWATGAPKLYQYGSNIQFNDSYNARLQPLTLSAAQISPANTLFNKTYNFNTGSATTRGSDNGTLAGVVDALDSLGLSRPNGSVNYTYDAMNRVTSAQTTGTACTAVNGGTLNWGESFTIDAWGNLTGKTPTLCSAESLSTSATALNQLAAATYDSAGNAIAFNGTSYVYDAEGRISSANGTAYTYDGSGTRVAKPGKLYWRGTGSDPLAETSATDTNPTRYIFFGGKRIARLDPGATTPKYYVSDNLGSTADVTDSLGNVLSESEFYPYGGEQQVLTADSNTYKFTGKERDAESGNDYFGARFYASTLGRFLSPDWDAKPTAVPYASFGDPQTLNLYAYVENAPLNKVDANGHAISPAGIAIADEFELTQEMYCLENQCTLGLSDEYTQPDFYTDIQSETVDPQVEATTQNAANNAQNATAQAQQQNSTQTPDNTLEAQNNTPPPPNGRTNSPAQGQEPNSTTTIPQPDGSTTTRTYGPDGKAVKDIDTHPDHGAGSPHAHDWDWGKKPPRQPGRPLTPEEQKNVKRAAGGVTAGVIIYWVVSEASRILFPPRNLIPVP